MWVVCMDTRLWPECVWPGYWDSANSFSLTWTNAQRDTKPWVSFPPGSITSWNHGFLNAMFRRSKPWDKISVHWSTTQSKRYDFYLQCVLNRFKMISFYVWLATFLSTGLILFPSSAICVFLSSNTICPFFFFFTEPEKRTVLFFFFFLLFSSELLIRAHVIVQVSSLQEWISWAHI